MTCIHFKACSCSSWSNWNDLRRKLGKPAVEYSSVTNRLNRSESLHICAEPQSDQLSV